MSVPCKENSDLYKILLYYLNTKPTPPIDVGAVDTALLYADKELDPIKEELKNEVVSIGYVFVFVLVFVVVISLLIFVLWISYEMSLSPPAVTIILILLLISIFLVGFLATRRTINVIETVVDDTLKTVSYNTPAFRASIVDVLNESAGAYMSAIDQPCVAPPM